MTTHLCPDKTDKGFYIKTQSIISKFLVSMVRLAFQTCAFVSQANCFCLHFEASQLLVGVQLKIGLRPKQPFADALQNRCS